ncbi:MAG: hypothetical protein DGJ47_001035 [Rickettsiaceae bacterium]
MNRAFIFPGQGSQSIGMGKDFFDSENVAKEVFEEVDSHLKRPLSKIIFHGSNQELADTANTQPAIMATSVAILKTILHKTNKNISELCSVVAGHSLGEYSALYANKYMSLEQAAKLLEVRSKAMKESCPNGVGAMAACIGIEPHELQAIIAGSITEGICQIANDNTDGQIVISGHTKNIDLIISKLKEQRKKAIKLNVSAAFHCDLMQNAEQKMILALEKETFNIPKIDIISNYTAQQENSIDKIRNNLQQQICGSVKWRETMNLMAKIGITELVEIGPGKVLGNLAKKSKCDFTIHSISNISQMDDFLETI